MNIKKIKIGIIALGAMTLLNAAISTEQTKKAFSDAKACTQKGDFDCAIKNYLKASHNPYAISNIAWIYDRINKPVMALKYYKKSLSMGNTSMHKEIGYYSFIGKGMKSPDHKTALHHLKKSIETGKDTDGESEFLINLIYSFDLGVKPSRELSRKYLAKSYKKGFYKAYGEYGTQYFNGNGVEKDEKKAYSIYKEGIKKSDPGSNYYYALSLAIGSKVLKQDIKSSYYYVNESIRLGGFTIDRARGLKKNLCKSYPIKEHCKDYKKN